ncbi:transglutaminase TgpA family protein [Microbacterium sp. JZ101]
MDAAELRARGAERRRRPADPVLALWTAIAVLASALPLTRVVVPIWLPQTVFTVAVVCAAGYAVRRTRHRAWAFLAEAAVWIACAMILLPASVPRYLVVPSPQTPRAVEALLGAVWDEVLHGVAPLRPSSGLAWVITVAVGLLAIAMSHVALTARLPLLAAVGFITVSLIPSLVVPQRVEAVFFVPLAVSILLMLRADTRARDPRTGVGHTASASVVAAIVGTVAVVAAMAIPPLLPQPVARPGSGFGPTTTIDADLDLGASLRQPAQTEVLQVRTAAGAAPYLRVATLSSFDGEVWTPDTGALTAVGGGLPPVEEIAVERERGTASVDITRLTGGYLPVPYAAVELEGVDDAWSMLTANRTLVTNSASSLGAEYTVTWERPDPTREQAQAAAIGEAPEQALALPELPAVIGELAAEVTADAQTPYDALRALQGWFRGGAFRYSLEAPVAEGFDGSGVDAIADFLEVRAGYCVHFASSFAVMARTLGIPTRVVVGYLPGTATGPPADDGSVTYSVTSAQLHAWPEAHLEGIGWVPFEPTASLGVPTNFLPQTSDGGQAPVEEDERPSDAPTPTASARPSADPGAGGADGADVAAWDPRGALGAIGIVILALLVVALPFVVRSARRSRRLNASGAARSRAVWLELVDTAIDAGVDVRASESPRALGRRLVTQCGAPEADVALLVGAVERASYARASDELPVETAAGALRRIRRALLPGAAERARASALPRSLVVRPRVDDAL